MKLSELDQKADRMRRKYCASLGVTYFPEWWDIKNDDVREAWRARAQGVDEKELLKRFPFTRDTKLPSPAGKGFENPEIVARAIETRVVNRRKRSVEKLRARFPWITE